MRAGRGGLLSPIDLRQVRSPEVQNRYPALNFDADKAAGYSPIVHVTPDDSPTLRIHGDEDRLVPLRNRERMHAAFEEKDVPIRFIVIQGAGHGFRGEDSRAASEAMVAWFKTHLLEKR